MEERLHPRLIEAAERGELRRDWRAMARRIEAQEGRWQLVGIPKRKDRGIVAHVTECLAAVGCRAQVVALNGLGADPRPWTGWAVFARIPRSHRAPDGTLW